MVLQAFMAKPTMTTAGKIMCVHRLGLGQPCRGEEGRRTTPPVSGVAMSCQSHTGRICQFSSAATSPDGEALVLSHLFCHT